MSEQKATIEEKITEMLQEQLGLYRTQIVPSARFVEDLGADSLDLIELLMCAEEEFNLEIPDEEADKILTVQNAIDYIKSKIKE